MASMNVAEELLAIHLTELDIPFKREIKLVEGRRFRWDFVISDLAIELQGGVWTAGKHTRGKGYQNDCIKMRLAIMAGYKPVHFVTGEVMDGTAIKWITEYLPV